MEKGRHPGPEEDAPSIDHATSEARSRIAYTHVVDRIKHEVDRCDDALKALPKADELLPGDQPWLDLAPIEYEMGKLRVKLDQLVDSLP